MFPNLQKNLIILPSDQIDFSIIINLLELLLRKNSIYFKTYIYTINKWSEILISNDVLFLYLNTIASFLKNLNDDEILLNSCLFLYLILVKIENFFKISSQYNLIKLGLTNEDLKLRINKEVNWCDLLLTVSKICFEKLLNENTESEDIKTLVKLITLLLERSFFQDNASIIDVIKNSKLKEIISCCKDLTQLAFIDMFKILIYMFSDNIDIINFCFEFAQHSLQKKIDHTNLSYLQFFLKCLSKKSQNEEGISSIKFTLKSISDYLLSGQTNPNENNNFPIIFQIVEECLLLSVFDDYEIPKLAELLLDKYSTACNICNKIIQILDQDDNNSSLNSKLSDLSEFKTLLLNLLTTILMIKEVKNLTLNFESIYNFLFQEILLSNCYVNTMYNSSLINIFDRLFCMDLQNFFIHINSYFKSEDIPNFLEQWIFKMENSFSHELRKINTISLSLLLPNLNLEIFLKVRYSFFTVCVGTVHAEMIKKQTRVLNNYGEISNKSDFVFDTSGIKTVLVADSRLKKNLCQINNLNNCDVHQIFVLKFTEALKNYSLSIESLIDNYISHHGLVEQLAEILGIQKSSIVVDSIN